jgi:hypothetical protein
MRDPHLDHQLERQPETVRLAQERRSDPRQPRRLLPADQRLRSLDRRKHGCLAQCERVAAWRHAEHAPVLAAELRRAVVADREADAGDVPPLGEEEPPAAAIRSHNLLDADADAPSPRAS